MSGTQRFVIAGGGLAGARAAGTLRDEGFDGEILLIGAERMLPYERPVLSKGYLLGDAERDSAFVHDQAWYDDHRVTTRLGASVVGLDLVEQSVTVESGERIGFDKLLIATGSWPRRIDVPGADRDGVLYLRNLPDADAIDAAIASGGPLVVVGAGWIGLEVAAAARSRGVPVTVVEQAEQPLQRVLGDEVGAVFADLHRSHGVDLRLGDGVDAIVGKRDRLTGVVTSSGDRIDASAVVVGIGAAPHVEWAHLAGLRGSDGIDVDAGLRSSHASVFAAGDIAAVDHPVLGRRIRVEHWAMAQDSGPVAARSMLDQMVQLDALPFFFTDQYDLGMEYVGHADPDDVEQVLLRGDVDGLAFQAFWVADGRVLAGMHVNLWDDGIDPVRALVASGRRVDLGRLGDPAVPLDDL